MKRLLSGILTAAMTLTLLAGCGGGSSSGAAASKPAESSKPAASASAPAETKLDWPKNNIKIICPYSAGGSTDLMARTVAEQLADKLGVAVTVENDTGGSGAVGMNLLASSKADGYTIIITSVGASTLTPNSSDVGYSDAEFAPICKISDIPNVFCVHKNLGVSSWEEFLALAEQKGNLTYGTSGAGLTQNVQAERMLAEKNQTGLITHIPFDGGSAAATALLGEQVDALMAVQGECIPNIKEGNFVPLFATSECADLPDVPTTEELGYKVKGGVWYGFAAPAGTDQAIVDLLDETIGEILQQDDVIEAFTNLNCPIVYSNNKDFADQWHSDFAANKEALAALNG